MATTKSKAPEPKVSDTPPTDVPDEPINPAIDPAKTAEERLDELTRQHAAMADRQARGESPD